MRMRGLFPSLGAGGSLIAAALCALAVLGGVFAFRGERPPAAEANTGEVTVPAGAVRARTAESRPARPAPAIARRGVAAARRPPVRRSPRVTVVFRRPVAPTPRTAPAPPPAKAPPAAAPAPVVTPRAGVVQRTVAQVRSAAAPVETAVEQVAATVDQTVAPLLP